MRPSRVKGCENCSENSTEHDKVDHVVTYSFEWTHLPGAPGMVWMVHIFLSSRSSKVIHWLVDPIKTGNSEHWYQIIEIIPNFKTCPKRIFMLNDLHSSSRNGVVGRPRSTVEFFKFIIYFFSLCFVPAVSVRANEKR